MHRRAIQACATGGRTSEFLTLPCKLPLLLMETDGSFYGISFNSDDRSFHGSTSNFCRLPRNLPPHTWKSPPFPGKIPPTITGMAAALMEELRTFSGFRGSFHHLRVFNRHSRETAVFRCIEALDIVPSTSRHTIRESSPPAQHALSRYTRTYIASHFVF